MKLNKFGKLYLNHAKDMTSGEISVITFISQVCSGNLKKYQDNPSISPKFCRIPTAKFMKRCDIGRRYVFKALKTLVDKGLIYKKKVKGKAFYFPAEKYENTEGYYGMVQEEFMRELTRNEKLVYGYLATLQQGKSECFALRETIMRETGLGNLQLVTNAITGLVKKGVINRQTNIYQCNTFTVNRVVKEKGESAQNDMRKSAQNDMGKSAQNDMTYINDNNFKDNNFVDNPASGEQLTGFFEKEKIQRDNIEILENFKNKKKDNITVLESFSKSSHISFRKESVHNYRIMLMTYISNLSPEVIDKMQDQGCSLNTYINMNVSEFLKNGIEDEIPIKPESIKKISESDKKYLQDYIDKRKLDSGDSFLDEVKSFSRYMFTIGEYSQQKLRRIIKKIYDDNNQSSIIFDFESKSKIDGDSNGREVW